MLFVRVAGALMEFVRDGIDKVGRTAPLGDGLVPPVPASMSKAGVDADMSAELLADLSPGENATLSDIVGFADLVPVIVARLAVPESRFDIVAGADTELAGDPDVLASMLPPPDTRATASCCAFASSSALLESLRFDGPCELWDRKSNIWANIRASMIPPQPWCWRASPLCYCHRLASTWRLVHFLLLLTPSSLAISHWLARTISHNSSAK
mmetsp:Transcript_74260/g.176897  ORF Transcript_74260/g.176897 Transcript_74260/m.176897 type:complete len:211 (+) Transcript_74260:4391-5023(+)